MLSLIIKALKEDGNRVTLYTSRSNGFLSDITQIEYHALWYDWKTNRILLSLLLFFTQLQLFFTVLFKYPLKKNQILYINTILPFGAALAGWLLRKKIIYHVHELYIRPNIMQKFAIWVMQLTANKVIFVSNYLQKETSVKQSSAILPNSLSPEFYKVADSFLQGRKNKERPLKNILMVSSLKSYKGVHIFLDLAKILPDYNFCLIAGASQNEVSNFINNNKPSQNLTIFSAQSNLHPFYQKADIILNLTIPTLCIETFGLTILEGMAYGLPVIAPPAGGPAELVRDGINGFLINPIEIEQLTTSIRQIFNGEELYNSFSEASVLLSKNFSFINFKKKLFSIINN